jgi:hypothetical protein
MPTVEELQSLLATPSESLAVEYKSWLDLSSAPGKAVLAKAAIAIANEGGGIVVLGMREGAGDNGALGSVPRVAPIARYTQDDSNNAIGRFAEPQFHCGLMFANHPATANEHAFIIVPGGMTVPVMSRRGCEGVIDARRCYVRKPGPRSEEPFNTEEWRGVMERCLHARRESMLDAIRIIVQGHGGGLLVTPAAQEALSAFCGTARDRWVHLVGDLPNDDDARMPHGHYELAFELVGVQPAASLGELLRRMDEARRTRHTGWGPFVSLTRQPFAPQPIEGNVEAWLGRPVEDRHLRSPAHCDFWRAHPDGQFFLLRGYDEDSIERVAPGSVTDITLPIWRVGEAMLFISRLARQYDVEDPEIFVKCRYSGLRGRSLNYLTPGRLFFDHRVAADDAAELQTRATATEIDENLVEVLQPMLAPLYEKFGFFELSRDSIRAEVERLRANRF